MSTVAEKLKVEHDDAGIHLEWYAHIDGGNRRQPAALKAPNGALHKCYFAPATRAQLCETPIWGLFKAAPDINGTRQ